MQPQPVVASTVLSATTSALASASALTALGRSASLSLPELLSLSPIQSSAPAIDDGNDDDARTQLPALHATVRDLSELNERVNGQNVALLGDLDSAQRAVRDLRAECHALALELKKRLPG